MNLGNFEAYKSWFISAGIAVAITLWLMSGSLDNDETEETAATPVAQEDLMTSVRVRDLTAEEVTRTITVNGRTAPARIVELNAETTGRVVAIGVERGERLDRGQLVRARDSR